jgi:hypothetical protein
VLLTDRQELADRLPKNGVGAEIGVAFGDYTAELVRRAEPSKLYLIDSWERARYQAGFAKVRADFPDATILRGLSTERIPDIPGASLDWCYLDTDHSYETASAELELILPKMKAEGRIAGDDYANGNPYEAYPYGVIPAVSDFCVRHGWRFEYLTMEGDRNPSFCLRRGAF